jgi:hypothetical protein
MHFLMSCSKYDKTRQDLFSIVGMTCIYQLPKLKYRRDILVVNDMRKWLSWKRCVNLSVNIVDDYFFFLTFLLHLVLLHWTRGGVYALLCYIFLSTTLWCLFAEWQHAAHIYFDQFIQFWNYTLITYCSSALDTRKSVSTKMLHFLEHRPLVSLAEKTTCKLLTIIFGICIPFIYAYVMLALLHWTRGGV